MAVMLGGKAAEEIIFGEPSTGARNDLEKATEMAISMVRSFGMSEKLGMASYDTGRSQFLGTPWSRPKDYSEDTARKMDEEVNTMLAEAFEKAKAVLNERTGKLKEVASILLEKEGLDGDELKQLLQQ